MDPTTTADPVSAGVFGQILDGMVKHPTECMLVLALVALAFLYRARESEREKNVDRVQGLNDRNAATLEKIIPVSEKLADGVTTLERLMTKGDH